MQRFVPYVWIFGLISKGLILHVCPARCNVELLLLDKETPCAALKCPCLRLRLRVAHSTHGSGLRQLCCVMCNVLPPEAEPGHWAMCRG